MKKGEIVRQNYEVFQFPERLQQEKFFFYLFFGCAAALIK